MILIEFLIDFQKVLSFLIEFLIVFLKVYREVDSRMKVFVQTLNRKLLEVPPHVEEQKNIIRYLLMFDNQKDPGWDCLCAYQRYITGLLWDSQTKYFDLGTSASSIIIIIILLIMNIII